MRTRTPLMHFECSHACSMFPHTELFLAAWTAVQAVEVPATSACRNQPLHTACKMAAANNPNEAANNPNEGDRNLQALRLQALFRNRFSHQEAMVLIEARGGLHEAAGFVMNGDPEEVTRFILHQREDLVDLRRINAERVLQELPNDVNTLDRLFSCQECNRYWWRKVPSWKQVSKCRVCRVKYDPVPREHEWGWAQFACDCGNNFRAAAQMNVTTRQCFDCNAFIYPVRIIPPSENLHRNRPRRAGPPDYRRPVEHMVYYFSQPHVSTGSTIPTFISQGALQEQYNFPIILPDIPEEGDDDDDDDEDAGNVQ